MRTWSEKKPRKQKVEKSEKMIKLTMVEMDYISLFEKKTGSVVKDCIIDNQDITFIVKEGSMGLAIGKNGAVIKRIKSEFGKEIHVYEYSKDPVKFLTNLFYPIKIEKIEIDNKCAKVYIDVSQKKRAIGKGGKKIKNVKNIISRHNDIDDVKIL